MAISEQTYQSLVLEDPDRQWELDRGRLREKPRMGTEHNHAMLYLSVQLVNQLNADEFRVRSNTAHVSRLSTTFYVPDVLVVPTHLEQAQRGRPGSLEMYADPLPLVVEVWSPSTGDYDVDAKLPEYRQRGDLEIWRLHPFDRTLTAWQRQPDGSYEETVYRGGTIQPIALPNVTINIDALWG